MSACAKGQQWAMALSMLAELQELGLQLGAVSWRHFNATSY